MVADGEWMYELYVDEVLPRGVKRAVGTIVVDARQDSRDHATDVWTGSSGEWAA